MVFLELRWEAGVYSPIKVGMALQTSCLLSDFRTPVELRGDTSGFSSRLGRAIGTPLEVRQKTQGPFPVATGILGFLLNIKSSQALTPFELLNSRCLSRCQTVMSPPVEMWWGPGSLSRVSMGDSDIPSCFEMNEEPAFKSLQGNLAFF